VRSTKNDQLKSSNWPRFNYRPCTDADGNKIAEDDDGAGKQDAAWAGQEGLLSDVQTFREIQVAEAGRGREAPIRRIRAAEDERLVALIAPRLEKLVGKPLTDIELGRLREAMPELKLRPKTLVELAANARFLVAPRPIRLDDKAAKLLTPDARQLLADLIDRLRVPEWQPERLEAEIRSFADQKGSKLGSVAQPLRAALTGSLASPGIFVVMKILGREESLGRIADAAGAAG